MKYQAKKYQMKAAYAWQRKLAKPAWRKKLSGSWA